MGFSRQEYWSGVPLPSLSLFLDAAPGKSGLHARGEGERVLALESREGTRASRRVEEGPVEYLARDQQGVHPASSVSQQLSLQISEPR